MRCVVYVLELKLEVFVLKVESSVASLCGAGWVFLRCENI